MTEHLQTASSNSPTFSDLPMDVLEKVVKKLDLSDCLLLRKVSRGLRTLVDSSELRCESIELYFERPYPRILIDEAEVVYNSASLRRWKHKRIHKDIKLEEIQKAIADVSTFLKNPKCKIDYFELNGRQSDEFLEFLKSLDFQLDVRSVLIDFRPHIATALQCMKPGNLETITLRSFLFDVHEFHEIVATEQWKMAKKLIWANFDYEDGRARMEQVLHFKDVEFEELLFDEEHLAMVRDILLKSTVLESGYITVYDDYPDTLKNEEYVARILSEDDAYDALTRRFSIPDSRDYFQLEFDYYEDNVSALRITRVSKH